MFAAPTYLFIVSIFAMLVVGLVRCAAGGCPQAPPVEAARMAWRRRPRRSLVRDPARLLVGRDRADRRRGDLECGAAVPAPQSKNAQRTLLLMGGTAITMFLGVSYLATQDPSDGQREQLGRVADRGRRVQPRDRVLRGADLHHADPGAGREHVVPGVPAAHRDPRPGQLRAATVPEPRRPARVLERHRGAVARRLRADRGVRREPRQADPAVHRRRVHGVHAVPGGNGPALAAGTAQGKRGAARVAPLDRHQRGRGGRHGLRTRGDVADQVRRTARGSPWPGWS